MVFNGTFLACQAAIPEMIANGGTVNVTLHDAFAPRNMNAHAKAAVNALTQCLASYHLADGIRIKAVLPGLMRTGMTEHYDKARPSQAASQSVAHRMAMPHDPSRLIRFLTSADGETFTASTFGPTTARYR